MKRGAVPLLRRRENTGLAPFYTRRQLLAAGGATAAHPLDAGMVIRSETQDLGRVGFSVAA